LLRKTFDSQATAIKVVRSASRGTLTVNQTHFMLPIKNRINKPSVEICVGSLMLVSPEDSEEKLHKTFSKKSHNYTRDNFYIKNIIGLYRNGVNQ